MAATAFLFTVFTPTYNRRHLLMRPYQSLAAQTCRDFEWIVVDDGSTDGTHELVSSWIEQADFPIRCFTQPNGHKKVAFNRAVRHARGELFICLDSDDELTPAALQLFRDHWLRIPEDERGGFLGLRGGTIHPTGERTGSTFRSDVVDGSWLAVEYEENWAGEILACDRIDLLRACPFPEDIDGYVPEDVVQHPLAARYTTRMFNDVVRIYHPSPDSISSRRTPLETGVEGPALYAAQALKDDLAYIRCDPLRFLKHAANFTRFHLHMWRRGSWRIFRTGGFTQAALILVTAPAGLALYARDLWRARARDDKSPRRS